MKLGLVGLGKMGMNMTVRLTEGGHQVVAFDQDPSKARSIAGAIPAASISELVKKLEGPRAVWVMVPSGAPTEGVIGELGGLLAAGDVVIDGGNSNFRDSQRRCAKLKEKGIHFLDAGTSGGVWGLKVGYCLMVGGDKGAFTRVEPIFRTLAPKDGYLYCGPSGAGHFTKMVHNGIEYGLLQAYGEGFEILRSSEFPLDLKAVAHLWNQGSVIRSWLCELAELAFQQEGNGLDKIKGFVNDSGEGRWTVQAAIDQNVPAPVITLSLLARLASRQDESYSAKVIAALRNQFGGHAVEHEGQK
ncbi:MAG TPA: decarboxylating 6-phosphogluconate dehydrogenase [Myxococcales bacterium]|nr:decarboxylating 6-phosphogluconate dehydrogenase [Myxococcales bacterium]